jgi:sec-independent protein translocase protein TatC
MAKTRKSETTDIQAAINKYSPFIMEVRKRVMFTLSGFLIGIILGFIFYEQILGFLLKLFEIKGVNIIFTSPFQFINLAISVGLVLGLIISFPMIIIQVLSFLKPALRPKEFKLVLSFLPFSIILFLLGFGFGAIIMKWQIAIFIGQSTTLGIGNMLDITKLFSVILLTSGIMGVGFQFPIVASILIHLKVISYNWLKKQRPWAYLISFIFALFLPPDSILVDLLLTLPLVFLFEITLILGRAAYKKVTLTEVSTGLSQ